MDMKCYLMLAFAVFSARMGLCGELKNGLYWVSNDPSGIKGTTQDGQSEVVGKKCEFKISESRVSSQSNANDQFYLYATTPIDPKLPELHTVIVCDGTVFRQDSSGSDQKSFSIGFQILGRDKAEAVAKLFGVPVQLRHHPGHCISVSFTPEKNSYKPGEEVTVKMRIENVGDTTFSFRKGGANRAARDTQYRFSADIDGKAVTDIGTNMNFGGLSVIRTVKPKEVFEDS